MTDHIPLFPLSTVLLPQGRIPLQIFEARYMDLVSHCLKNDECFGLCLISQGREVLQSAKDAHPSVYPTGCLAKIVDWDAMPNNKLKIVIEGQQKFHVEQTMAGSDQLLYADIDLIEPEAAFAIDDNHNGLQVILQQLCEHPMLKQLNLQYDPNNAVDISYLLSQYLPISETDKLHLLANPSTEERLHQLTRHVAQLADP